MLSVSSIRNAIVALLNKASASLMGCMVLFGVPFTVAELSVFAWKGYLPSGGSFWFLVALALALGAGSGAVAWYVVFKKLHSGLAAARKLLAQQRDAQPAVQGDGPAFRGPAP
jgi:hypothetical protein